MWHFARKELTSYQPLLIVLLFDLCEEVLVH